MFTFTGSIGKFKKTRSARFIKDVVIGLISRYNFEEGSGSTVSDSIGSNDGTVVGGMNFSTAKVGDYSISFDGVDSYVSIPSDASMEIQEFTIAGWVFMPSGSTGGDLFHKMYAASGSGWSSYKLAVGPGFLGVSVQKPSVFQYGWAIASIDIPSGEWVHVAGSYKKGSVDVNDFKLYVNGVLDTGISMSFDNRDGGFSIQFDGSIANLGASGIPTTITNYFDGFMDDVRLYDSELSEANIVTIMTDTEGTFTSNLVSRWNFEEGSGTTISDGNGSNDGTLVGGIYFSGTNKVGAYAGQFDGADDYVYKNDADFDADGNWTITTWINPDSASGGIFSAGDSSSNTNPHVRFQLAAGGLFCSRRDDSNTELGSGEFGGSAWVDGNWHHVVASYNGSSVEFFIDGVSVGNPSWTTGTQSTEDIAIGALRRGRSSVENYFNGNIDDFRIYDRALTSLEVQQIYDKYK